MLVIFSGIPGTGKTTLAEHAAAKLRAPVFGVDIVEAALWRAGIRSEHGSQGAAYGILSALAEAQLRLGQSACIDAVVGLASARESWSALAARYGARIRFVECVCSDRALHRRRIESRQRNIPGWYELTWEDVERSMARFEPWQGERLILDAANELAENLAALDRYLLQD
jgi:predicted kinase